MSRCGVPRWSDEEAMNSDRAVLLSLIAGGPATRPALAALTGLSKPTVSESIRRLAALGLVVESGTRTGLPGRAPSEFGLDADCGRVAGLDIGGSFVRAMVVDITGRPVAQAQRRTPTEGWARVVTAAGRLLDGLLRRDASHATLLAVGISTTGVVSPATHAVSHAYAIGNGDGFDLMAALRRWWDVPLHLENNVNCAALGEHWRGAARGVDNVAFVSVGAGVGLGLLLDGRVVRGFHGAAGEIAYLPVSGDQQQQRSLLEDLAGSRGILQRAARVKRWPGGVPTDVEDVFQRAQAGDPIALNVVEEEGRLIGEAVAALSAVFDPEMVVLGGGTGSSPLLMPHVSDVVRRTLPYPPRLQPTSLDRLASLWGAVALGLRSAQTSLVGRVDGRGAGYEVAELWRKGAIAVLDPGPGSALGG